MLRRLWAWADPCSKTTPDEVQVPLAGLLPLSTLTVLWVICVEISPAERCGPAPSFALEEVRVHDVVDEGNFRFLTSSSQRSLQDHSFTCSPGHAVPRMEDFAHLTSLSPWFDMDDSAQTTAATIARLLQATPRSLTELDLCILSVGRVPRPHPVDVPVALWTLLFCDLPTHLFELELRNFPSVTLSGALLAGVHTPAWLPQLRYLSLSYPRDSAPDLPLSSSITAARPHLEVGWYESTFP
ncbi:hypothetical protein JCM10449v2_001333 [Rhodotorula kratochvilovae]